MLNGIITHYTVYCEESDMSSFGGDYSLSLSPIDTEMENGTIVGGSSSSAIVSGLMPYTTYACLVTASTSAGEGNSSRVVSAKTDESGIFGCNRISSPASKYLVKSLSTDSLQGLL